MRSARLLIVVMCLFMISVAGCGKKELVGKTAAPEKMIQKPTITGKEEIPEPISASSHNPITHERTIFSFEHGDNGFEIPSWLEGKPDNAGKSLSISKSFASDGEQSLCLYAEFPGKIWTSALVELEQYLDFTPYRELSVDVYVPENTPLGLKARIVLTVGKNWKWTEMVRTVPLIPGEWVTISSNIEAGSMDWKRTVVTNEWRSDIRKIVMRIESNKRPIYTGPIYIDNVKVRW